MSDRYSEIDHCFGLSRSFEYGDICLRFPGCLRTSFICFTLDLGLRWHPVPAYSCCDNAVRKAIRTSESQLVAHPARRWLVGMRSHRTTFSCFLRICRSSPVGAMRDLAAKIGLSRCWFQKASQVVRRGHAAARPLEPGARRKVGAQVSQASSTPSRAGGPHSRQPPLRQCADRGPAHVVVRSIRIRCGPRGSRRALPTGAEGDRPSGRARKLDHFLTRARADLQAGGAPATPSLRRASGRGMHQSLKARSTSDGCGS